MEKIKISAFTNFKLENIGNVWGGQTGQTWTYHTDYTAPNCTPDDACWVCDSGCGPVASK